MEFFRQTQKAYKYSDALIQVTYMQSVARTPLLPRDLFLMAMSCRMHSVIDTNGKRWWGMPAVKNVSDSLDVLGSVSGSILVRGPTLWQAVDPGTGLIARPWWWAPPTVASLPYQVAGAGNVMNIADDADAGLLVEGIPSALADGLAFAGMPLTPGPSGDWRVEGHINASLAPTNYSFIGIAALASATREWARIGAGYSGAYSIDQSYGTLDNWLGGIGSFPVIPLFNGFFALDYTSATDTLSAQFSADGKTWVETGSILGSAVWTSPVDYIGVACAPNEPVGNNTSGSCDRLVAIV